MIIFNTSLNIISYSIFEEFTKSVHECIMPVFSRSPFCVKYDNMGGIINTSWNLAYQDKHSLELFLVLNAKSTFKFDLEEKQKDLNDYIDVNDEFYTLILGFIRNNCFGYMVNLPKPPPFHFEDDFDLLTQRFYGEL